MRNVLTIYRGGHKTGRFLRINMYVDTERQIQYSSVIKSENEWCDRKPQAAMQH